MPGNRETIVLIEDACNRESTFVGLKHDRLGWINTLKIQFLGEGPFQFPECQLGMLCPFLFVIPKVF